MATSRWNSSFQQPWKYHIFLSSREEDTRKGFTAELHEALKERNIKTFMDYDIRKRQGISPELIQAIEESLCAIVIFSKDYASSSCCLDELSKIVDCKKSWSRLVLPVFYNIDPSDGQIVSEIPSVLQKMTATELINGNPKFIAQAVNLLSDLDLSKQSLPFRNFSYARLKNVNFISQILTAQNFWKKPEASKEERLEAEELKQGPTAMAHEANRRGGLD
ncbi:protein VARIATION IN COMPOUND TRIGGERED ROOT growth response-like [Neltuma alba]|uniref:protein VARIATION IN COMPOUND TRIGGERED ROOT growth response-like n=1 Tax=Neltuma alba TaxID=207710 RepID=UPI0010A57F01|nr:protein VARIATION IN COMPOUND TRIGGERED ROOT growth response-like [Prosopis alba]